MPTRLHYLLLFLASLVFYSVGNGTLPLIDRDEPRFSEASREMLQRNDWVVPFFNGRERYDKPPLIYWAQAASYKLFGENSFAARFPAVLFAACCISVVLAWGSRMWGAATGWRAAAIFGLCLQMLIHGRSAVADMPMVLFSTLAAWMGWEMFSPISPAKALSEDAKPSPLMGAAWYFWIALGFGFLAKGPIAWVPLGMLWFVVWRRKETGRVSVHWVFGSLLMLVIVGSWGIPALIRTHGEFASVGLGKHVGARYVMAMEGHGAKSSLGWFGSLPFYFVTAFLSFFPWSIWLPGLVCFHWRKRKEWDAAELYLVTGVILVFAIFTLSRTKLPHYTLPAFPFLALLLARWWGQHRSEVQMKRWKIGAIVAGVLLPLIGSRVLAPYLPSRLLYQASAGWMPPETELATVDFHEPSITWEFRKDLETFTTALKPKAAKKWMAQPGPRACIYPEGKTQKLFPSGTDGWQIAKVQGVNLVRGKKVDLALAYKPKNPAQPLGDSPTGE